MSTQQQQNQDCIVIEKLAINVNGRDKFATGLTKSTTVDDLKYAMLCSTETDFDVATLDNYAVVEQWQGHERLLDGRIRVAKLLRVWQSVPGNQLAQVRFLIKKKANTTAAKLTVRDANIALPAKTNDNKFAFCTLSPDMAKTWSVAKCQRSGSKSSYVRRQLQLLGQRQQTDASSASYATISRTNRSKTSTIKRTDDDEELKSDFVALVERQTAIIDEQMRSLVRKQQQRTSPVAKKSISAKLAESLVRTSRKLVSSVDLGQKQSEVVGSMDAVLDKMDDMICLKTHFIQSLEHELKALEEMGGDSDTELLVGQGCKKVSGGGGSSTSSLLSRLSSKSSLVSQMSSGGYAALGKSTSQWEDESDTGISSAGSEDSSSQLETLV